MTWIKLDDKSPRHPKIAILTDKAYRWWVNGLCYASEFLTNGILPPAFWKQVPKQSRAELSDGHLWDWKDPNFEIHDYLGHQTSKETVERKRAYTADRVARYRAKRNSVTSNAESVTGNAPVTTPEDREQKTDTENREQRGEKRPPTLIARNEGVTWFKRHGNHVDGFCDWVCLDRTQVDEFAGKIPGSDLQQKREQIRLWATAVRDTWSDRIVPDGSHFDFWRNRWTEQHGGSRPANATLKAARAANDIDEAFR